MGPAAEMSLRSGDQRIPLAGPWKYRVERSRRPEALYTQPGELAAHVAFVAGGGAAGPAGATLPAVASVPDVVIQLSVVPNEMKYTLSELTVQPGQLVEVVFTNPDQMPHNFALGAPGSLQAIGAAADQFAQTAGAAAEDFLPAIAQVLFKTKMVEAGQTVRFQFRAPSAPGQYTYLCSYPNHWRLMSGVLSVGVAGAPGGPGRGAIPNLGGAGRGSQ